MFRGAKRDYGFRVIREKSPDRRVSDPVYDC